MSPGPRPVWEEWPVRGRGYSFFWGLEKPSVDTLYLAGLKEGNHIRVSGFQRAPVAILDHPAPS